MELRPAIEAYFRSVDTAPQDIEDQVQETLTRLLEVSNRLDRATVAAYAIVIARNLTRSALREASVERRNRHRLYDGPSAADPTEQVIAAEERSAIRGALAQLPPPTREQLLDRYADESAALVTAARSARLARGRAALRVGYVVTLRGVDLPSPRCRSVLLAVSARDRRRQTELGAGRHLLTCQTCQSLAEPLARRNRVLAGLLPWPLALIPRLRNAVRHPAHAVAGVAAAATVVAGVAIVTTRAGSHPASGATAAVDSLCALAHHRPNPRPGNTVVVHRIRVAAVTGDETFRLGTCDGLSVRVMIATGGESKRHVRAGDCVSFPGRVTGGRAAGLTVPDRDLALAPGCAPERS